MFSLQFFFKGGLLVWFLLLVCKNWVVEVCVGICVPSQAYIKNYSILVCNNGFLLRKGDKMVFVVTFRQQQSVYKCFGFFKKFIKKGCSPVLNSL